ncbi:hypothetical protein D3C75_709700 [compost metagenome]
MHHVADVAFVDAHAESDGGDDAIGLPAHEATLDRFPLLMGQPGVISLGLNAVAVQVFGDVLGCFLQSDIDDARLVRTLAHPFDQASALVRSANRLHQQIEVRAIETGGHHIVGGDGEFRLHVGDDLGRRRCGQQQHLRDVELALIVGKLEVVRAKVMPPFGNAVRLVHHQ